MIVNYNGSITDEASVGVKYDNPSKKKNNGETQGNIYSSEARRRGTFDFGRLTLTERFPLDLISKRFTPDV